MRRPTRLAGARHRGERHVLRGEPCCDALLLRRQGPGLCGFVVCDGAGGSAAVARGAAAATRAGWRALLAVHRQLRRQAGRCEGGEILRRRFRHAFHHFLPPSAPVVNHTLLGCLWDRRRLLVAAVGDTSLLVRRGGRWFLPMPPARGDFANETTFLRPDTPAGAIGLWSAPAGEIEAVIGFTDGLEAAFLSPRPGCPEVLELNDALAELVIEQHHQRCGGRGYPAWLAASLADPSLQELSDDDRTLVIAG